MGKFVVINRQISIRKNSIISISFIKRLAGGDAFGYNEEYSILLKNGKRIKVISSELRIKKVLKKLN